MLTQMDITTDGFGYMLSFGDLVWVPFTYGIQARYLAFHPVDLGFAASAAIVALNVVGFYIFRTSNSDKDSFRKHDNPKSRSPPKFNRKLVADGKTLNTYKLRGVLN